MPRILSIFLRSLLLFPVLVTLAGCGQKGAPLAPLRPLPAQVTDVRASRLDDTVSLQFTVPAANIDGTAPADLGRVDVFAVTGDAVGPAGRPLTPRELETLTSRIASIEVQPAALPVDEDEEPSAVPAQAVPATDSRPVQGAVVSVTEALTPELLATPFEHPDSARVAARQAAAGGEPEEDDVPSTAGSGRPLLWLLPAREPTRTYLVLPYSTGNRPGPPSAPLALPYVPAPPAPPGPTLNHTATAVQITWENPAGIRLPVQRTITEAIAKAEELIPSRPLVTMGTPQTYRVYEMPGEDAPASAAGEPLNAVPLEVPAFEDPRVQFGVARCYAVRAVEQRGSTVLQSHLSPSTCITPRDVYPPLAPTGLTAVGSEGGVSLIWEPNAELDLGGYLVMRGLPGEALKPIVETPVLETTFRDTTAEAGVLYEYSVVAVDRASPPNVSPESNRVRESAR